MHPNLHGSGWLMHPAQLLHADVLGLETNFLLCLANRLQAMGIQAAACCSSSQQQLQLSDEYLLPFGTGQTLHPMYKAYAAAAIQLLPAHDLPW
jgi:hypothetical protein